MTRSSRTPRQLVVGDETFLWAVGHEHRADGPRGYEDCREVLVLRRPGSLGRLRIVFAGGPGHLVPDGLTPSGCVGVTHGPALNLHEPGTVRALLDEARARGSRIAGETTEEIDGWALFASVAAVRQTRG
ncbi:hypothetical protein OG552_23745 [Streptomyces sp. NBC_01476]|uniref:hypothetical protein n=1 Tax=Streptomyces sp. NBC_01476 TaxID=2903881 RepID=UPI002E3209A6|nr:hypothetical protein [Streptomyces sp. NBC_01476]